MSGPVYSHILHVYFADSSEAEIELKPEINRRRNGSTEKGSSEFFDGSDGINKETNPAYFWQFFVCFKHLWLYVKMQRLGVIERSGV